MQLYPFGTVAFFWECLSGFRFLKKMFFRIFIKNGVLQKNSNLSSFFQKKIKKFFYLFFETFSFFLCQIFQKNV